MMEYEIADIMFLVKCLKSSSDHFNICDFVEFCAHSTRGSSSLKLKHKLCRTHLDRNFYFNRIPRLWNSLPTLDINLPLPAIKSRSQQFFWDHFMSNFDSNNMCSFHYLCPCPRCSHNPVNMHFSHSFIFVLSCPAAGSMPVVRQHSLSHSHSIFIFTHFWLSVL